MLTTSRRATTVLVFFPAILLLARIGDADSLRNPETFIVESAVPLARGTVETELTFAGGYEAGPDEIFPSLALARAWGVATGEVEIELETDDDEAEVELQYLRSLARESLGGPELAFQVGGGARLDYGESELRGHLAAALLMRRGFSHGRVSTDLNVGWVEALDREGHGPQEDGGFLALGLSLPAGKTFHGIPSNRSTLDRRLFLMGRVRQMTDVANGHHFSPGVQIGFRWTTNPRGRTWNVALGWDEERAEARAGRSSVWAASVTRAFARGHRVRWRSPSGDSL